MKKLLATAAFAAFALPAAAQTTGTVEYDVAGLVPVACGLNIGTTIDATATDGGTVEFDFTGVASTAEVQGVNAGGGANDITVYCNSVAGVTFDWTVDPLVRTGGNAANPSDVIDFRVNGQFASPYTAADGIDTGYTTGVQLVGQNATAFLGADTFVTTTALDFIATGVQAANGAYTKNAGDYEGAFTLTLTAN